MDVPLAAGMLGRCRAEARPGAASLRMVLVFQALVQSDRFVGEGIRGVRELVGQATAPFRQLRPGIDLRFFVTTVNPGGEVIACSGPDVVQLQGVGGGVEVGAGLENGLLFNLTAYLRQSNVNREISAAYQDQQVFAVIGHYNGPILARKLSVTTLLRRLLRHSQFWQFTSTNPGANTPSRQPLHRQANHHPGPPNPGPKPCPDHSCFSAGWCPDRLNRASHKE